MKIVDCDTERANDFETAGVLNFHTSQKSRLPGAWRLSSFYEKADNQGLHGKWETEAEYEARKKLHSEQFRYGWSPANKIEQGMRNLEGSIKRSRNARRTGIHERFGDQTDRQIPGTCGD